jgi:uncharacterized membrane protein YbhN (UPF0104 family)
LTDSVGWRGWVVGARVAVSAVLLWIVFRYVDVADVGARLLDLEVAWVVLGLVVSVLQVIALAWRWRFTAARLGIELPLRAAVGEYYLGILLNQLLPGGVAGDVSRAWRHARTDAPTARALRSVVLERASAQVVMTLTALGSVLWLPWAAAWVRASAAGVTVVAVALLLARLARPIATPTTSAVGRLWADAREALLSSGALLPQLLSAVLVIASYIAVFVIAGRAVGVDTPLAVLLPLVAPVLMTMLVPISVAGWGLREAAAAALWSFAGMTPEDGTAVSVAYGLLVLVSASPGLLVLTRTSIAGRDRRGRPPPS